MSKLWQGLEEMLGPAGVPAAWQSWMGPEFGVFRSAFLQRSARPAKSVPCPRDCGCAHRVVEHPDGSLVGVCDCDPWNCDDIPLKAEDVVILQLNPAKLGRAIARAFKCEAQAADFGLPGTWQVAAYSTDAVPVVLTIQNDRAAFQRVVAELTARLRKRFILLGPTRRFLDVGIMELLENVKAGYFDLESHLTLLPSGILQARPTGGEFFSKYLPEAKEPVSDDEAQTSANEETKAPADYLIKEESRRRRKGRYDRTQGSTWRIWFEGEEIVMPGWVGADYLVFLIRNQGKDYNGRQLTHAVRKGLPSASLGSEQLAGEILFGQDVDGGETEAQRGRVGELAESDLMWDKKQLEEVLRRIKSLGAEIDQYEAAGDFNSEVCQGLKTQLGDQRTLLAANAKKLNGKWVPKAYQKGSFEQKADVIRKHIRKVLDEYLRENCRRFYDHLNDRNTLIYGVKNGYRPKPRVAWEIQLKGGKTGT